MLNGLHFIQAKHKISSLIIQWGKTDEVNHMITLPISFSNSYTIVGNANDGSVGGYAIPGSLSTFYAYMLNQYNAQSLTIYYIAIGS